MLIICHMYISLSRMSPISWNTLKRPCASWSAKRMDISYLLKADESTTLTTKTRAGTFLSPSYYEMFDKMELCSPAYHL